MPDGIIIGLDVIIKARPSGADGRRVIECEASNEVVDAEGDVILQRALLDSAASFAKSGHLDLDHLSEIGERMGIANPMSYIIGRPLEVKDLGKGRTGVVAEIMRSNDGSFDAGRNKYDAFWQSLQSNPPVVWKSSVYGYPNSDSVTDCREEACDGGATRYLVKGLDWRSLAMTRNPINTAIKGVAKIVTVKSYIEAFAKDFNSAGAPISLGEPVGGPSLFSSEPRTMDELWGQYHRHIKKDCPHSGGVATTATFKNHFVMCCGAQPDKADMLAHALMHAVVLDRRRVSN